MEQYHYTFSFYIPFYVIITTKRISFLLFSSGRGSLFVFFYSDFSSKERPVISGITNISDLFLARNGSGLGRGGSYLQADQDPKEIKQWVRHRTMHPLLHPRHSYRL